MTIQQLKSENESLLEEIAILEEKLRACTTWYDQNRADIAKLHYEAGCEMCLGECG